MSAYRRSLLPPLLAVALACTGSSVTSSKQVEVPVSRAGPDQAVASGAAVALDGSASTDAAGAALAYQWAQTVGTPVVLSSATVVQPTFTAPTLSAGQAPVALVFSLVVTSANGTGTSTVTITVNAPQPPNPAPVASAGPNQSVLSGADPVTLDGSASADPDGQAITYAWTQTAGPAVTLSSATTAHPTFVAPVVASGASPASLAFSLVVTDADASSSPATVTVVVNPGGSATCSGAVPPPPPGTPPAVAVANPPPLGGNGSHRFEIGTDLATGGLTVVDPAGGEPTVEGFVVVAFVSPGAPAPADAVVTLNGVPLTRFAGNGLFWHVDANGPQPRAGPGSVLVISATATDPSSGKPIQRTLALQCPQDVPVAVTSTPGSLAVTPSPGSTLAPSMVVNLQSDLDLLFNQASPLFSPYGPKATLRGYEPCTRALGDGVTRANVGTANGFDVNIPVAATTSGAYLLDVRWPGVGFLDGETGGYCQLAKRFYFSK